MPGTDQKLLIDAAKAAGEIALKYFKNSPETWEKAGNQGPVTEADIEIDNMLRGELLRANPDYGWLSEETQDNAARLDCEYVFIIDPIDGTRAFINGNSAFSHSLAIARRGKIVNAVVHLPALGKTYCAQSDKTATCNDAPIIVSNPAQLNTASVLATKANMHPDNWDGGEVGLIRHTRPSLAYRLCLVGQGRFDSMLTLRDSWEWDVAAGDLIVTQAGGRVSTRHGLETRYNNASAQLDGMIAAPVDLHKSIMQRLKPAAKQPIALNG